MSVDSVEIEAQAPAPAATLPVETAPAALPATVAPGTLVAPAAPGALARLGDGVARSALFGVGAAAGAEIALRVHAQMQPHPMPHQFGSLLESPWRLRYRNVSDALGLYGIEAGMQVLDLGCGTGLFTAEIARMVGDDGMVRGVDIQAPMVEATRARLLAAGLADRVTLHHAGAYSLPLDDGSMDLAVLIATLGEIPDRLHALLELQRVIKPNGRLAISEELPDPSYMTARSVRRFAEEAGFRFDARTGTPFCYHSIFTRL